MGALDEAGRIERRGEVDRDDGGLFHLKRDGIERDWNGILILDCAVVPVEPPLGDGRDLEV